MRCKANGKEKMSQLTDEDFNEVAEIKGIGAHSAEVLRTVYKNFNNLTVVSGDGESVLFTNELKVTELSLSVRAKNSLMRVNIHTLSELLSLNESDLMRIRNIGVKTREEILEFIINYACSPTIVLESYRLENISDDNHSIPIQLLTNIGISQKGVFLLLSTGCKTVGDLCDKELSPQEYAIIRPVVNYLSSSIVTHFISDVEALKDNARVCIMRRSDGATLKDIGDEIGVTRERVRQIILKTCRQLRKTADIIAGILFTRFNNSFLFINMVDFVNDEKVAQYCKLALMDSEYALHFNFSDKYIRADVCPTNITQRLSSLTQEVIGEGVNFYDKLDFLESELERYELDFLDFDDVMNYLIHNRYHFYGDYVTKGRQPYGGVCHDAVRKYFPFDIKLDSAEDNEDMHLLRKYIAKHYQGIVLPLENRALTAGMVRDSSKMVLSGRGRYCPIEKVIYSVTLFDDVCSYIHHSDQTTFYYSELFAHFKGRFLAETNIHNFHFLHGMLKSLYPSEFVYERDLFVKNNVKRQDVGDRMVELLKQKGRAVTKNEVRRTIPGINDFVFAFTVIRLPDIIQWSYNEYNHTDNLDVSPDDIASLRRIIENKASEHSGYCSDSLLYTDAKVKCSDFLVRNNICAAQNLYYIAAHYLGDVFNFRRPHIVTSSFPVQELNAVDIARVLLKSERFLSYESYCTLAYSLGWAPGALTAIFNALEKEYVRLSINDYEHKNYFQIPPEAITLISSILQNVTKSSGYYSISSFFDYEIFPNCGYEWNGFLLETIISEYDTGFRILHPQVRDRRYQRGIIIPFESSYNSLEELIVGVLIANGIKTISESEFEKFLRIRGVISTVLPHELYESSIIQYKNEMFNIVDQ